MAQLVKNQPSMRGTWVLSLGWEDPLEKAKIPTPVFWPGQSMDCVVHGVAKSWTWLSDLHFTLHPVAQTLLFAPYSFLESPSPHSSSSAPHAHLYETLHMPRWSHVFLVTGWAALDTGLWLRFAARCRAALPPCNRVPIRRASQEHAAPTGRAAEWLPGAGVTVDKAMAPVLAMFSIVLSEIHTFKVLNWKYIAVWMWREQTIHVSFFFTFAANLLVKSGIMQVIVYNFWEGKLLQDFWEVVLAILYRRILQCTALFDPHFHI